MLKFIAKIFGTKSDKDIKKLMPLVEQTNREGEKLTGISNDELRNLSFGLRDIIATELKSIDEQLAARHGKIAAEPDLDLSEKERIFGEIDNLELERNQKLEKVLLEILPRAFAIVRETARRFRENENLEVTAREYDRLLAAR
ncbi:MAG: preprotein translocase subunit SecA, partial [Bacteroidota bacterium]